MTSLIQWLADIAAVQLAQVGGTDVTIGMVVAFALVSNLAIGVLRRLRRF